MNIDIGENIKTQAQTLLEKGEVRCFIGFEKGQFPFHSPPAFIDKAEQAGQLVWDDFCIANLSKYLINFSHLEGKIGLVVKGCDSRGIIRLIQDNQVSREKLVIIGVPCRGMKDASRAAAGMEEITTLPLAEKCTGCLYPNPIVYDVLIGEKVDASPKQRFKRVEEIEKLGLDEKYAYWSKEFARCIRCYACRNICPACNCRSCYLDQHRVNWNGKAVDVAENVNFNLTRAIHVAGRCIECGECERACPVGVPIMAVNRKIIRDINSLFGSYEAGVDLEDKPPLDWYRAEDPDGFR
jgi:ferredoxin